MKIRVRRGRERMGRKEREFWKRMHFAAATEYKRVPFCPGGP